MTSAQPAQLCRISVFGPGGRADLAVPVSVSVAGLLPILLRRTSGQAGAREAGSWVLQRLGEQAFDPAGTPESLDWQDGEQFYLRPAGDPLPELDFDDIADGVATMVGRRGGRWKPEFNRWLFFGFSVAALLVLARTLLYAGAQPLSTVVSLAAGVALLTGMVVAVGRGDRALILLLGLPGCGFIGLGTAVASDGTAGVIDLAAGPVLVASVTLALSAVAVLAVRAAWAATIPFVPFAVLLMTGTCTAIAQWLRLGVGLTPAQAAGILCAALLVVLIFVPRMAIRLAKLRGPQLPRTAEELQFDIDPALSEETAKRTAMAEDYLTIAAVGAAVVFVGSFPFLIGGGVFAAILAVLLSGAVLLRARAFRGVWQRVCLASAGATGLGLTVLAVSSTMVPQGRGVALVLLACLFVALLLAMLREPPRRQLPIWGHLANGLETITAIAVVPLLLQLFDVFVSMRDLAG